MRLDQIPRVLGALVLFSILTTLADEAPRNWTLRHRYPPTGHHSIAFGNGLFVATGWNGVLMTSPDGVTWTERESGTSVSLNGTAYGNGRFVVVGHNDTQSAILTSPDGTTWTLENVQNFQFDGAIFVNGRFVAHNFRTPYVSEDGIGWTTGDSFLSSEMEDLAYGNGLFVAVGGQMTTSRDGLTWATPARPFTDSLTAVAFGNGVFVAVGSQGRIGTSTDGAAWSLKAALSGPPGLVLAGFKDIAFGGGLFVAVGSINNGGDQMIWTSPDGIKWTWRNQGEGSGWYGVAYGNGKFVALSPSGHITTSDDGLTWVKQLGITTKSLNGVAYAEGNFVAVGSVSANSGLPTKPLVLRSSDGGIWEDVSPESAPPLGRIAHGSGTFVALSSPSVQPGAILTSADGRTWSRTNLSTAGGVLNVTYGGDQFVVVGQRGTALTSPDGISWAAQSSQTTLDLAGVAYGNRAFVAVGGSPNYFSSVLLSSPDGRTWTAHPDTGYRLMGVAFGNGIFVAVRWYGSVLVSKDGTTWSAHTDGSRTERASVSSSPLREVVYGQGRFVAFGDRDTAWASYDGRTWTELENPGWNTMAFGQGRFVAVGALGRIWQSDVVPPPFTVSVAVDDGGFNIRRFMEGPMAALELTVNYTLSVKRPPAGDTKQSSTITMGLGESSTWVHMVPRDFQEASLTLVSSDLYSIASPAAAAIRLDDAGLTPRFRVQQACRQPDGTFSLTIDARAGAKMSVETSQDLRTWVPWQTVTNSSGAVVLTDSDSPGVPSRFFRLRTTAEP